MPSATGARAILSSAHSASTHSSTCASKHQPEDEYELTVGGEEAPGHALTLAQTGPGVVSRTGDARIAPPERHGIDCGGDVAGRVALLPS